ncbi:hypothetical protein GCM10007913_34510 [Devosia yakushimensis]|uniref:Uncharacterized protein n=1 Tax=Devosia yakushimensis TaxID=470028 RepID=A0ABQ5UIS3_9HYPH|nr:hypothetical protein GCM10007913_34510 [Devosia yakushimensis]
MGAWEASVEGGTFCLKGPKKWPKNQKIDSFLFGSMRSPACNQSSQKMRSALAMADMPMTPVSTGGGAALMTKTTKTA